MELGQGMWHCSGPGSREVAARESPDAYSTGTRKRLFRLPMGSLFVMNVAGDFFHKGDDLKREREKVGSGD